MADVELLPLPELPRQVEGYSGDYWEACQVEEYATDYARACVEANIAPLQAENERLLAEVEDYRTNGAAAVRFAPNSAHWSNELRRLFGDDARAGIEVLESGHRQELARAERLAEALRWAERHCPCGARPESPDTHPHVPGCLVGATLAQEDRNG